MTRFLNFLKNLFRVQPSLEDQYLAAATDLYDLERRMRQIEVGGSPAFGY